MTAPDFGGEIARLYHAYRPAYPPAVAGTIAATLHLDDRDTAIDIGCGTGELTLPLARLLGTVVGTDPEPDMLALARDSAARAGIDTIRWVEGRDTDLPAIVAGQGIEPLGVVTVATAVRWTRFGDLCAATTGLLRPGGGLAVVTNGTAPWKYDTDWSRALHATLRTWRRTVPPPTAAPPLPPVPDTLHAHGFTVTEHVIRHHHALTTEQVTGFVLSTFSRATLPTGAARADLTARIADTIGTGPFPITTRIRLIIGRLDPAHGP